MTTESKMPDVIWARESDPQFNLWSRHEGEKGKRSKYHSDAKYTRLLEENAELSKLLFDAKEWNWVDESTQEDIALRICQLLESRGKK